MIFKARGAPGLFYGEGTGSHSREPSGEESGDVCRCLIHTEEVTGSIPVSPTQLKGLFPARGPALFDARAATGAATGHPGPAGLPAISRRPAGSGMICFICA